MSTHTREFERIMHRRHDHHVRRSLGLYAVVGGMFILLVAITVLLVSF